jgi:hypothetical protein
VLIEKMKCARRDLGISHAASGRST